MSIGVFCNVAERECGLLRATMKPLLHHPGVEAIVVVHTGSNMPDAFGEIAGRFGKVREIHRPFGEGYHLSVEEGGYDQYSARLFGLKEIERAETDWIIQFDADEFLTSSAIDKILTASDAHDIVAFDYYTPLSRTEYWFEPKIMRRVGRELLVDPHILIWRRRLEKRPTLCESTIAISQNRTRHCSVSFPDYPYWRTLTARGFYHFHFHCSMAKENTTRRTAAATFSAPLPPEVVECMFYLEGLRLASVGGLHEKFE